MARRPSGQGWGESGGGVRLVEPDVEPWAARRRRGPTAQARGRPADQVVDKLQPARATTTCKADGLGTDQRARGARRAVQRSRRGSRAGRGLERPCLADGGGGPPHHAAVVQPLPFPTTKSSSSKPVKRSGLWWTRGLPPVEDRDRRGTTWRTGRRACGCRPWRPCVIRSPPPDPAWNLHTARGRAIDLHRWFT